MVCDRFANSTRVYQGVAGKVDPMAIRAMERIIVGDTKPDLTFILDVPAKEGMRRAAGAAARTAPTVSRARRWRSTKSCATAS